MDGDDDADDADDEDCLESEKHNTSLHYYMLFYVLLREFKWVWVCVRVRTYVQKYKQEIESIHLCHTYLPYSVVVLANWENIVYT